MALKTFNPTTPSQRELVLVDRSELYKGKPVKTLTEGSRRRAAATPMVMSPSGGAAAGTSSATGWSTSSAASSTWRVWSSGSNTIRTAPPSSR